MNLQTVPVALMKKNDRNRIISEMAAPDAKPVNHELFELYSKSLRKAVDGVLDSATSGSRHFELQQKLELNAARFAAAKAFQATKRIQNELAANPTAENEKQAEGILNRFNQWLDAERNTAIARTRTAKQWNEFNDDPVRNELYPNIRWIPSRSANPREQHMDFYNRVWAKSDPFWIENQPGNLWNCKCDWEETDEPTTAGKTNETLSTKGLKGNPALSGEIFSQDATYFEALKKVPGAEKECDKALLKNNLSWARENLKPVKRDELKTDIQFSTRGIKEYLNQPMDDYLLKNELIRKMESMLEKAPYKGVTTWKGRKSHIFEITFLGKKNYIIANEYNGKGVWFYSITESNKVLMGIEKP